MRDYHVDDLHPDPHEPFASRGEVNSMSLFVITALLIPLGLYWLWQILLAPYCSVPRAPWPQLALGRLCNRFLQGDRAHYRVRQNVFGTGIVLRVQSRRA